MDNIGWFAASRKMIGESVWNETCRPNSWYDYMKFLYTRVLCFCYSLVVLPQYPRGGKPKVPQHLIVESMYKLDQSNCSRTRGTWAQDTGSTRVFSATNHRGHDVEMEQGKERDKLYTEYRRIQSCSRDKFLIAAQRYPNNALIFSIAKWHEDPMQ